MAQYTLLRGAKQLLTLRGPSGVRRGTALHDLGIIEDGSILIRDGVIAALGPSRRVDNLRESRDALEISANGLVVCPGFIDANINLSLESRGSEKQTARKLRKTSDFYNETLDLMRSCLQHGTLTAEIKASADTAELESDVAVLRQISKIGRNPIEIFAAWRLHRSLTENSIEKFKSTLATLAQRGLIRSIEFVADDDYPVEEQLYSLAQGAGISSKIAWRGGSHERLTDALVKSKARTVTVSSSVDSTEAAILANSPAIAVLSPGREMGNSSDGNLRQMIDSGAAVALSSGYDSRYFPGFSMEVAISLAILRGGMTTEEAFAAATVNAAHALGCEDVTGTLEVDKRADILVLTVPDYREIPREFGIGHVGMVIRDGSLVFNRTRWKVGVP